MQRALVRAVCGAAGLRRWRCGVRLRSTRERSPRGALASLPQVPAAAPGPGSSQGTPRGHPRPGRVSAAARELWLSQRDEFPRARKGLERKPLCVERTKGSEILFGVAPCSLALTQERRDLFRLFLKQSSGSRRAVMGELVLQATARGVPVCHIPRRELDQLCRGQLHQGVCLEATPLPFKSLEDAEAPGLGHEEGRKAQLMWLVLEQIQDPMNLGALLRSAYFLGVDRVVTSRRNSCPLTPTVSKASAGAVEVFDVYSTDDLQSFLKAKTAEGWEVVGTVSKPEDVEDVPVISCLEFRWDKPIILVIGSEGEGLSLETQLLCHRMLAIPPGRALHPGIESLNVSVATGILLHSICSQKRRHGD